MEDAEIPAGPRPTESFGTEHFQRPKLADVKTSVSLGKRPRVDDILDSEPIASASTTGKENIPEPENTGPRRSKRIRKN